MESSSLKRAFSFSPVHFHPGKPLQKRAGVACLPCRRRKVRCDLALNSGRCTNCRLDGTVCKTATSRRRGYGALLSNRGIEKNPVAKPPPRQTSIINSGKENLNSVSNDVGNDSTIHTSDTVQSISNVSNQDTTAQQQQLPGPSREHAESSDWSCLPGYIEPLNRHLHLSDLRYLSTKNVFRLLPSELQHITLCRYAEFIHSIAPIFDLSEFLAIVEGRSKKKISLLLYHAVTCAGLSAVEDDHILKHGYGSKAEIRLKCYLKGKLLFDLDADTSRIVSCQAALLFISWSASNHRKDAIYWTGVAISQAYSLRLHKEVTSTGLGDVDTRLRRRLWWVLLMREADVMLAMGQTPRLCARGMPMLHHGDFDKIYSVPKDSNVRLAEKNRIDPLLKQRLQELCIEKARLSLLICEIQHTLNDGSLIMANDASSNLKIWELHTKLEVWYLALPTELLTRGITTQGAESDTNRALLLNTSVVLMTYCMAMTALHKSSFADSACRESSSDAEIVSSGQGDVDNEKAHAKATRIAASRIMEILQILQERDLTKYVPAIGVAVVCAAASVFLLDARSTQTTIRQTSLDHLDTCVHSLRTLATLNFTARDMVKIVELAVHAVQKKPRSPEVEVDTQRIDSNLGSTLMPVEATETVGNDVASPIWTNYFGASQNGSCLHDFILPISGETEEFSMYGLQETYSTVSQDDVAVYFINPGTLML